jgi:TolA-binding protein
MVRPEAKIRYLEFELEEKERVIKMMENAGSGAGEDRVAALEKKVNEMEALVKGLTQELLDLKSIAMKMSKQTEERSRQELKRMQPIVQGSQVPGTVSGGVSSASQAGGSTVIIRRGTRAAEAEPEAPAEPAMDMIMQPDGTMKLEPRRGDKDYIVASAGYGRNKKGVSAKPKQSDLIYAVEEDKSKDSAKK